MPVRIGGLLDGLNVELYDPELMIHPMWWVSSEGALLLSVLSVVFFVCYSVCCPARAGECSLNVHDTPAKGRQGNNILLMSAAAEAEADGAQDPEFMQLPRSYEVVHDAPIARPPPPQQWTTVKTSICPLDVRIVGDPKTSGRTVVTLHDAGVGAASAFDTFLRQVHGKRDFDAEHTCIYHISLPGHSEEAKDDSTKSDSQFSKNYKFPGVDELSLAVVEVIKQLKMGFPVGLGVGVGADILLRSACRSGDVFAGLVLVDVSISRPNVLDRLWLRFHRFLLRTVGHNPVSTGFFASICFSRAISGTSSPMMVAFRKNLARVSPKAITSLLESAAATKPLLDDEGRVNLAELPIMLLVGTGSRPSPMGLLCQSKREVDDAVKLNRLIGYKSRVSVTRVSNCRRLVTEEDPHSCASPFVGFLTGASL
eukprot:INCI19711.1.p1 GENE.INCI19711.1~~INCI19711.1.p1  ORF type:complete len:425 (-),score=57.91 INCI19711.1:159-1433(-)